MELEKTVYGALSGRYPLPVLTLANGIDLVPSTLDLAGAEIELSSKIGRELTLMKLLKPIIDNYDYILIDCPPSLGILTVNALTASDIALVPVTPGKFSLMGLQRIIEIFNIVKDLNNNKLKDFRILITNFDARKSLPKQFVEYVNGAYGDKVFKTHIRTNAALEDAQMRQATVFETDLKCNGAEDYLSVSKEITEDKYINI